MYDYTSYNDCIDTDITNISDILVMNDDIWIYPIYIVITICQTLMMDISVMY